MTAPALRPVPPDEFAVVVTATSSALHTLFDTIATLGGCVRILFGRVAMRGRIILCRVSVCVCVQPEVDVSVHA